MSRLILAAAASFLTAALPLAAHAADEPAPAGPTAQSVQPAAPKAPDSQTASAASSSTAVNPIPQNYPVPADQAAKLLPSDPGVVTNGPVPDTPANRAKDGQPLSNGGRTTQPAGN